MKSYDYAHRSGVRCITWDGFASLAAHLAELLEPYKPQLILGVARAGLFPATAIACSLRRELFPIRLTRRLDDEVVYDRPVWKVPVPSDVAGKVVAVVDELADTGQILTMVVESALALGAARVVTACLVAHTWAVPAPHLTALTTDEFVFFPWDARVYSGGKWVVHPEIEAGLKAHKAPKDQGGNTQD